MVEIFDQFRADMLEIHLKQEVYNKIKLLCEIILLNGLILSSYYILEKSKKTKYLNIYFLCVKDGCYS